MAKLEAMITATGESYYRVRGCHCRQPDPISQRRRYRS